jgi:heme A synthase
MYLLIGVVLILLSGIFALRNKRRLNRLENVGLVAGIVFGVIGAITFLLGNDFPIPLFWREVILAGGIIVILVSIFTYRISRIEQQSTFKPETQILQTPDLKYGRPIVRKSTHRAHGGIYNTLEYFIEVVNTTPNTLAQNCEVLLLCLEQE